MKAKNLIWLAVFSTILVFPSFVSAATVEELQAQINALMSQIQQLQAQLAQIQGGTTQWCHDFNANLGMGNKGDEVSALYMAINKENLETQDVNYAQEKAQNYFSENLASAVTGFQEKYKDEILTPLGLKYGTGYVGKATRAKLNKLYGCGVTPPPATLSCVDTDGKNYNTKGTITENRNGTVYTYTDVCYPGGSVVKEYFCSPILDNFGASEDYTCPNGCRDGACVSNVVSPSITVLSPNGGETWQIGNTYEVKWNPGTISSQQQLWIALIDISKSPTAEGYFVDNIHNVFNTGFYNYKIHSNVLGWEKNTYKIAIYSEGEKQILYDTSDAPFSIVAAGVTTCDGIHKPGDYWTNNCTTCSCTASGQAICSAGPCSATSTLPSITVLSPNGGESWQRGSAKIITWSQFNVDKVTIGYKTCASCLDWIVNNLPVNINNSSGSYVWNIPASLAIGANYQIYIIGYHTGFGSKDDTSDAPFSIVGTGTRLSISLDPSTPSSKSIVVGSNNVEVAKFKLTADNTSDVRVASITIKRGETGTCNFGNLALYDGTTPIAVSSYPSFDTNCIATFFTPNLVIPKSTSKVLSLVLNVLDANTGVYTFQLAGINIEGLGGSINGIPVTSFPMTVVSAGSLNVSLISGPGASPSIDQTAAVGTVGGTWFAFKLTAQSESQRITSLKLTAASVSGGSLNISTLRNIKLYEGNSAVPFASAPQFDTCSGGVCSISFVAANNLLSAPVSTAGTTIYVKADIAPAGIAVVGDSFEFSVAGTDIKGAGAISATVITGTGEAKSIGTTFVVGVPVANLPDLIVSDFSWTPTSPKSNENIALQVKIKNIGLASAQNFTVSNLWDSYGKEINISTLAPNGETTIQGTIGGLTIPGPNTVSIYVDTPSKIVEGNENNNYLSKTINVSATFNGEGNFTLNHWGTLRLNNGLILYADGFNVLGQLPYKVRFKVYDSNDNYKVVGTSADLYIGDTYALSLPGKTIQVKVNAINAYSTGGAGWSVDITASSNSVATPSITVLSPNGGEAWPLGSTQIIRWSTSSEPSPMYSLSVSLVNQVSPYNSFTIGLPSILSGSFIYTVGNDINGSNRVPVGSYKVRIVNINTNAYDLSDTPFSIVEIRG